MNPDSYPTLSVPEGYTPEEAERFLTRQREASAAGRVYVPPHGWERYESRRAAAREGRPLPPCLMCGGVTFADGAALNCFLCRAGERALREQESSARQRPERQRAK